MLSVTKRLRGSLGLNRTVTGLERSVSGRNWGGRGAVTEVFNWGGTQSEKSSLEIFFGPLCGRCFGGGGVW